MDDGDDALFEDDLDDVLLADVTESLNIQPATRPKVISVLPRMTSKAHIRFYDNYRGNLSSTLE